MTSILAGAGAAALVALTAGALAWGGTFHEAPAGAGSAAVRSVQARTAALRYAAPVGPPVAVSRSFEAPPTPWGPGHRGVDLISFDGAPMLAPADGIVTFAGPVAGRPVVSITHPDGLRSSIEPVVAAVAVGKAVKQGQVVGMLEATTTHCAPRSCVHWGVRNGETYLDPMTLIPLAGPVVLLPLAD